MEEFITKQHQITVLEQFSPNQQEIILRSLLRDKTTKKNILWGTDSEGHDKADEMLPEDIFADGALLIEPRTEKAKEQQNERTKAKAEVFTPSWVCCRGTSPVYRLFTARRSSGAAVPQMARRRVAREPAAGALSNWKRIR